MPHSHSRVTGWVVLSVSLIGIVGAPMRTASAGQIATAVNDSMSTACAEFDNVNVALRPPSAKELIRSFQIEAYHPQYAFEEDHRDPNFDGCVFEAGEDHLFQNPGEQKLFDDGETVVVATRQDRWWQPGAMGATVLGVSEGVSSEFHRIAVHRKLRDEASWPQVLVFYQDGNLRLIPHKQPGREQAPVFGSSVIVGPARRAERPFVTVQQVEFDPEASALNIVYDSEESARIILEEVSRELTRVRVEANFALPDDGAFATFRSMYVEEGNADVGHVQWQAAGGEPDSASVMAFTELSSAEFFFNREAISVHNTSAPDIRFSNFKFQIVPEPSSLALLYVVLLAQLLLRRSRYPSNG